MKDFTIYRSTGRKLKFKGELLGEAYTTMNNGSSRYSGSTGRCTELELYQTSGGNYVFVRTMRTCWQGERDTRDAWVCKTIDELLKIAGEDRLSLELFENSHIDTSLTVE